jgi:hypothetical protein
VGRSLTAANAQRPRNLEKRRPKPIKAVEPWLLLLLLLLALISYVRIGIKLNAEERTTKKWTQSCLIWQVEFHSNQFFQHFPSCRVSKKHFEDENIKATYPLLISGFGILSFAVTEGNKLNVPNF